MNKHWYDLKKLLQETIDYRLKLLRIEQELTGEELLRHHERIQAYADILVHIDSIDRLTARDLPAPIRLRVTRKDFIGQNRHPMVQVNPGEILNVLEEEHYYLWTDASGLTTYEIPKTETWYYLLPAEAEGESS